MERNRHVDEGTLHAWLDGALGPEESARVEAHVAECAACGAKAAEARGLIAAASRILTALDDVPGGVVSRARPARRPRLLTGWPLRAAAAIVFVAVSSFAVVKQLGEPKAVVVAPQAAPQPPQQPAVQAAPAAAAPQGVAKKAAVPQFAPMLKETHKGVAGGVAKVRDSSVTLTGRVISAKDGQPLPSASVALSNPRVVTATNAAGAYALPVPARQAAGQQAALVVRRLGFEAKTDSVTVAPDAAPHDVQLAPSTLALSQVVVAGAAAAAQSVGPSTCYVTTTPGLPARIQLGDSASWTRVGRDSLRIMLTDSTGTQQQIVARMTATGLSGVVTAGDSGSVRPFAATRCP
jgi:anti-sigma factor RsiW